MGLSHSTYVAYGVEIPATTDFERLDEVLATQPEREQGGRVEHTYLGDYERLFLLTESTEVEENTAVAIASNAYARYEIPAWNKALHAIAVRLGHEQHPLPTWLVLHDHS
jgi:hypothetical protein